MKLLFGCLLLAGLAGCGMAQRVDDERSDGEQTPSATARQHAIYIDGLGKLRNAEDPSLGVSAGAYALESAYTDRIIAHFKTLRSKNPKLRLTLFIHGGLNTYTTAWGRADIFSQAMLRDGHYPVFVGWNSGFFANYADHALRIRKGEHSVAKSVPTLPIVLLQDFTRSIIHIPEAWYRELRDPVVVSKSFFTDLEENANARIHDLRDNKQFTIHDGGPITGVGASYWSILNPAKLLTAPIVDGFGTGSWKAMLRRTDLVLSKPEAFEGPMPDAESYADTAVTTFLKRWESDPALRDVPITLIGHSMGTIVANNILARHPGLPIDQVVYMGAAARIKDVENVLVPWMRRPGNTARFYNLSLDPYREISENNYYDFGPRGSLLHWIDHVFGDVNSFKDRAAGGWWNMARTAADIFPAEMSGAPGVRLRVSLTRFPIGGPEMGPQKHGEFDNFCFWRESFWKAEGPQQPFPDCANAAR